MAKDIVQILQDYSTANDYRYTYGSKEIINLIQSNSATDPDKVHLLLENVSGEAVRGGGRVSMARKKIRYVGNYFLVLPSDFATHKYNENEKQVSNSQYELQVKPLLEDWKNIDNQFSACDGYDVKLHKFHYGYNIFDANLTGLLVSYQIEVYE